MDIKAIVDSSAPEAGVLGSMIIDSTCIGRVLPLLPDEEFFAYPAHRTIYQVIIGKFVNNEKIDGLIIRDELERRGELEGIGGVEYLTKMVESLPSAASVEYYAQAVQKHKKHRDIIAVLEDISNIAATGADVKEKIDLIQKAALSLNSDDGQEGYYSFNDHAEAVSAEVITKKDFIKTGFHGIDYYIDGYVGGELVIVAGRPSMGKSCLALQMALTAAATGLSVIFFTLEMTYKSLIRRALINDPADKLKTLDIIIHERANTPEKQISFIKTRQQTHKVDIIFIDYLQLMTTGGKSESRNQEVTTISRQLKLFAVSENIPIIALSQLNRAVESRENHRPRLSDLRESGSIEQDADIVLLIHRAEYYRQSESAAEDKDGSTEIVIAKNRRGPIGIAKLVFLDEQVAFGDEVRTNAFSG